MHIKPGWLGSLALNRFSVLVVAGASLAMAYAGRSAYALLEEAYELPLVALFVPMMIAIHRKTASAMAANATMLAGALLWLVHRLAGFSYLLEPWMATGSFRVPLSLGAAGLSLVVYLSVERLTAWKSDPPT